MPAPIQKQRKASKYQDAKLLIASLSIAVTLGLGGLFSNQALRQQKASLDPAAKPPAPPPNSPDFPPLPTLIPLVSPVPLQASAAQTGNSALPLRAVTAPAQVVVQKIRPVFDQPDQVSVSGGGSSRGVTSTRPSR